MTLFKIIYASDRAPEAVEADRMNRHREIVVRIPADKDVASVVEWSLGVHAP